MKKLSLGILIAVAILAISGIAAASMLIPANENAKENAKAPEKSPVITETDSGNWGLERVDFIHYAKPSNPGATKTETCYKLLGVKWSTLPVNYVINPTNPQGLPEEFVTSAISTSAETWDSKTNSELFNDASPVDYNAKYGVQDYKNAVSFGNYQTAGVIAVTSVWYTRVGKRIVEFDVMFDTDWTWGDLGNTESPPVEGATVMDLQNIATHELGHGIGLADIYSSTCSAVTMYGYSNYGETQKRTLETPDVTGIQKLYGGL